MNIHESGVYTIGNGRHAPSMEETGSLEFNLPDSPAPIMNLVIVRGGLWGILPGCIISDQEAKRIPKSRIARRIPEGTEVDFYYDEDGLLRSIAYYDENGPDVIKGLSLWGIGEVQVRWETINYD